MSSGVTVEGIKKGFLGAIIAQFPSVMANFPDEPIEEAIAESSRFVVFEPNNPQTWRALIRLINPFMQDIKDKGGLYDFAVQCDEETNTPAVIDRNELVARVFVKPTKTAEFIELNFVLTATGADFKEIFKTG